MKKTTTKLADGRELIYYDADESAVRDAALLCRALTAVHRGEADLRIAVESYEHDMLARGFAAVAESLERLPDFTPSR